jgi:hypothetical protein
MDLLNKLAKALPSMPSVPSLFSARSLTGKLIQPVIEPFPTLEPLKEPEILDEPDSEPDTQKEVEVTELKQPEILPEPDPSLLASLISLLKSTLSGQILTDFTRGIISIQKRCKGDGAGLTSGVMIDMFINDFFSKLFKDQYMESHIGECDLILNGIPLSLKKIKGKSMIALDWSKNNSDSQRERFTHPIMVLNTKTMKWKRTVIQSGIYLIDQNYCKTNVTLGQNNKTDSLITSDYLQKMLENSIQQGTYFPFEFPEDKQVESYRFV